jgi:hypothetical protein
MEYTDLNILHKFSVFDVIFSDKVSTLSFTSVLDGVGGQRHGPATLLLGKRPGTHSTGGWVGLIDGPDGCEKFRLHWDFIAGPSNP